jgi:hypothetical protein
MTKETKITITEISSQNFGNEIGEKLKNSTHEMVYYLQYNIFNIDTFYIRIVTLVGNIYVSYTLCITNVPQCGAKVKTQRK